MINELVPSSILGGAKLSGGRDTAVSAAQTTLAYRLNGDLDASLLERCFGSLLERHEVLRTTFHEEAGTAYQEIAASTAFHLERLDLREVPAAERERRLERELTAAAREPLDLEHGPLLRAWLVEVGPQEHVLLLVIHHLVFDGWSERVLFRELGQLYEAFAQGQPSPLAALPFQYADFAAWQQRGLADPRRDAARDYWKAQLQDAPSFLELPTDHPRPSQPTSAGRTLFCTLPKSLSEALRQFSRQAETTLFVTLLATFKVLLYRYTAQDDLVVGTAAAQRNRTDLEGLVGFFANTVALRTRLSGNPTFRELLQRVQQVTREAFAHQELPFEQVVQTLAVERRPGQPSWLQVMFVLHNATGDGLRLPGLQVSRVPVDPGTAKFELTLIAVDDPAGIALWIEYNAELFDPATIERLHQHFQVLLEAILQNPNQPIGLLPLLTNEERKQILVEWNSTATEYPRDKCIHQLFEEQVEKNPEAVALRFGDRQLTYRQLNRRANQLAHYLKHIGVGRETPVAICVDRSFEMVIGLLGILKAGGAYVPLNPDFPRQRLMLMLNDTEAPVLITTQDLTHLFPEYSRKLVSLDAVETEIDSFSADNSTGSCRATDLAYVMYTSGSTGQPKGTSIVHRGVVRLAQNTNYLQFDRRDVFLQLATLAFDASTFEIWGPLLNGATLAIAPQGILSLVDVGQCLRKYGVTTLWLTAGFFHQMVDYQLADLAGVRQLLAGGDVLSPAHVRRALSELCDCRVINGYGPTENTTFSCCYLMDRPEDVGHSVSLGRPISNTQAYVLDEARQPVPIGVPGELYVGGEGLAREYWRQPQLTQEKFVLDPFNSDPGARLYRTGDRVRWRADGSLEFLGRLDQQVKIRGFRVEPGEIEYELQRHPDVLQVAVQPRDDTSGDKRLVAYVVTRAGSRSTSAELRDFLVGRLPHYMLPAGYVFLSQLPLTASGKLDRRALVRIESVQETTDQHAPPENLVEAKLCDVWQELLGVNCVGTQDSFFTLGGDSLTAIRLISRIRDIFQVELPVVDVYKLANVAGLAQQIQQRQESLDLVPVEPLTAVPRDQRLPLSSSQLRLWFLHRLEPGNQSYRLALAYRLRGDLDASLLERCFGSLLERHEVLRTTFHEEAGTAYQEIAASTAFHLERLDLREVPAAERERQLERELTAAAREPLDLEHGPLLRAWLVEVGPQEHVLLLVIHHLVFDGWSERVLFRELGQLYEAFAQGQPSPLAALPFQYADFATWQQRGLADPRRDAARDYWKTQLQDAPSFLELPTDHPRPSQPTSAGRTLFCTLPKSLSEALRQFSRQAETTLFVTLLATFKVLLYRYTAQDDLVVGTAAAQRNRTDLEGLVGFFANTVALRTRLAGNPTFRELLQRVQQVTREAFAHQELPFEQVVQTLAVERRPGQPSWLQVMFVLHNATGDGLRLPGLQVSRVPVDPGTAKFELTLIAVDDPAGIALWIEYNAELFDPATIERLKQHFQVLLEAILQNPNQPIGQLPLLTNEEQLLSPTISRQELASSSSAIELNRSPSPDIDDAARRDLEDKISTIWRRLLGVESVGVHDNFFELGGHSLLIVKLAAEMESTLGIRTSIGELFQFPTIEGQAGLLNGPTEIRSIASLVTLQNSSGPTLIILPGTNGAVHLPQSVLRHLPQDLCIVGINIIYARPDDARDTIEELAAECVELICASKIPQPYQLIGYSFGGMLAYEVARQLRGHGLQVGLVGIIDTGPVYTAKVSLARRLANLRYFAANAPFRFASRFRAESRKARLERFARFLRRAYVKLGAALHLNSLEYPLCDLLDEDGMNNLSSDAQTIELSHLRAFCKYAPGEFSGTITLFRAMERPLFRRFTPDFGWRQFPIGAIDIRHVPGDHTSIMSEPHCQVLARQIFDAFASSLPNYASPDDTVSPRNMQ